MKTKRVVFLVMVLAGLAVWSLAARAGENNVRAAAALTEADALKLAQDWATGVSQSNVAALEKLLADQYVHIHATALIETKTQFLSALKNGSRKYEPIQFEDVKIRLFGCSTIVTGKFNLKVFAKGKTIIGVNRFTLVLARTDGDFKIVSFQATPIPQ